MIAEIRDDQADGGPTTTAAHYNHNYQQQQTAAAAAAAAAAYRPVHDDTDEFGNPSRGDNFRQEFEAPFYPSVNLDKHPETIRDSWAVVTPPPESDDDSDEADAAANVAEKRKSATNIDRSDESNDEDDSNDNSTETVDGKEQQINKKAAGNDSTSKPASDAHNVTSSSASTASNKEQFNKSGTFQPDFQGGFKPIYPPGMKVAGAEDEEHAAKAELRQRITLGQPQATERQHGTKDDSIGAVVYDGLGASIGTAEEDSTSADTSISASR